MKTPHVRTNSIDASVAALAIVTASILTGQLSIAGAPEPPDKPASFRADSLTATVLATDPRGGTLDLLTGVGHALRIRRIHLAREVPVMRGHARVAPGTLTPGCVVRVACHETAAGMVASRIELLQTPTPERKP